MQNARWPGKILQTFCKLVRRDCNSKPGTHARLAEMSVQAGSPTVTRFAELEQLLPHSCHIGSFVIKRFAKCDGDTIWNFSRQFREETSALKREDRTPQLVEPCGHDRRFGVMRDELVAAPQAQ